MSSGTIITSMAVTGAMTALAAIAERKAPRVRTLVGVGVAGTILLVVNGPAPELASSFAVLIATTAVLVNGVPVFAALTRYLGS